MNPKHAEIWNVNMGRTVGAEIRKSRPAIVISSDSCTHFQTRLVVPITGWKEKVMKDGPWFVQITPDTRNCLDKVSAAACHQIRAVDLARFLKRIGVASASTLLDVKAGLMISIDYTTATA